MAGTPLDLVGKRVRVDGLVGQAVLNGSTGTVLSFDRARKRCHVRFDGASARVLAIKPENCQMVADGEGEVAVGIPAVVATGLAGNASSWALRRMQQVIGPEEQILGVWQISDRARANLTRQACAPLAFPLCWPVAVCCAPCLCSTTESLSALHGGTIYAVTDQQVWKWVEADPFDTMCMGLPLLDQRMYKSGNLPLYQVSSIAAGLGDDSGDDACDRCCPVPQLVLGAPPGHFLANARSPEAVRYHDRLVMYVEQPDQVGALVRSAREAAPHVSTGQFSGGLLAGLLSAVAPEAMMREPMGGGDARETLTMLDELLECGLITRSEYDTKRAEVVAGIGVARRV